MQTETIDAPAVEAIAHEEVITVHTLDVTQVQSDRDTILGRASGIIIQTPEDVEKADELLLSLARMEGNVTEFFRPVRESTTKAWKEAIEAEKKMLQPLTLAKRDLGRRRAEAVQRIEAELARKRREAEEAARKEAEENALREAAEKEAAARQAQEAAASAETQAAALRAEGRDAEADEMLETAEQNRQAAAVHTADAEQALNAPTPVMPAPVPVLHKTSGIASRAVWSARVTDLKALVEAAAKDPEQFLGYLQPNETALNGVARALKEKMRIPGVVAESTASTSVKRKA